MGMQFQGVHGGNLPTYSAEQRRRARKTDARTIKPVAQAFAPYTFQIILVSLLILFITGLSTINSLMIQRVFDDGIVKRNFTWLLIDVGIMIVIPIGIKLRERDKQSSFWHHKEKH